MKKDSINIILPDKLYFIKGNPNIYGAYGVSSPHGQSEYNLYYKNFVYPFNDNLDIEMRCEYGKKYKDFWQFDGVCDKDNFELELMVYSPFGELLASKKSTVHIAKDNMPVGNIICMGDSMTRAGVYIKQLADTLPNVKTLGTKCFDGSHYCEGRGGWHTKNYFETGSGEGGISPFLFPKTVDGEKYYGDVKFWKRVLSDEWTEYDCVGLQSVAKYLNMDNLDENDFPVLSDDGDVVYNDGMFRKENGKWVAFSDELEFDFSKYMKRYSEFFGTEKVDIISILLGTNDFYFESYDKLEDKIKYVSEKFKYIVKSVKAYDNGIKIIFNLPVLLGGVNSGEAICQDTTLKRGRYKILSFAEKLLEIWDNEEAVNNGIYISPMLNMLDMESGFDKSYIKKNKYSEEVMTVYENFVHPSHSGYKQMGDALSGVVACILDK